MKKNMVIYCFCLLMPLTIVECQKGDIEDYKSTCITADTYIHISMQNLLHELNKFEGKFIETEGYFSWNMEELAIYQNSDIANSYKSQNLNAIWLEPSENCKLAAKDGQSFFFTSNNILAKTNKHKIRIRGKIIVAKHGHLGLYNATLGNISFIEVLN